VTGCAVKTAPPSEWPLRRMGKLFISGATAAVDNGCARDPRTMHCAAGRGFDDNYLTRDRVAAAACSKGSSHVAVTGTVYAAAEV
jgi:hypothetical protein